MIVLGILVGIGVPVLFQAWRTLRAAEELLTASRPKVERALTQIASSTEQLSRLSVEAEAGLTELRAVVHKVDEITQSIDRLRASVSTAATVGAALGPAFAAGVKALFTEDGGTATAPHVDAGDDDRREEEPVQEAIS